MTFPPDLGKRDGRVAFSLAHQPLRRRLLDYASEIMLPVYVSPVPLLITHPRLLHTVLSFLRVQYFPLLPCERPFFRVLIPSHSFSC